MKVLTAGTSRKGNREENQDFWARLSVEGVTFLIVADGNGGGQGGRELAETAVKTAISWVCVELSQGRRIESEEDIREVGIEVIQHVTQKVLKEKELHEDWCEAGTTITLVLLVSEVLGVFWIGDSPCYLYSSGEIRLLTNPVHTLAEMLIESGETRESLANQPGLNSVLTRCVGHDSCEPSAKVIKVKEPCLVLVGSDGVFGHVSEEEVKDIIGLGLATCFEVQELSNSIVQKALDNGSDDNASVVAALVLPELRLAEVWQDITILYEWRG